MSPLIADRPYPTEEGVCPDAYSLRVISPAYASPAGELNAVLQYMYHYHHFVANGYNEPAKVIESIAVAEMFHLKLLGATVLALGAAPVYTFNPPCLFNFYSAKFVSYSRSLKNMIEDDIIAERHAVMSYAHMLDRLRNDRVSAIISRILEDEKLHLKAFTELLNKISD